MEETLSLCVNAQSIQSKRVLSPRSGHEPFHGWNLDKSMGGETSNRAQERFCAFHKVTDNKREE